MSALKIRSASLSLAIFTTLPPCQKSVCSFARPKQNVKNQITFLFLATCWIFRMISTILQIWLAFAAGSNSLEESLQRLLVGNHDFYRLPPKNHKGWLTQFPSQLINAIHPIENVHILNNAAFEDDKVYIYGFTASIDYYQMDTDNKKNSVFHPGNESKAVLLRDINSLTQEELHKLPVKKARIALVHSPVYMQDEDVLEAFKDFDLTISGHMHNGAVPPVLQDFWRSDKGLVAPGKALFPKRARSSLKHANDKNIICGAVTTIHDSSSVKFLNKAFPIFTTRIDMTKNIIYKRKPNIKNQYINPRKTK